MKRSVSSQKIESTANCGPLYPNYHDKIKDIKIEAAAKNHVKLVIGEKVISLTWRQAWNLAGAVVLASGAEHWCESCCPPLYPGYWE